MNLAEAGEIFAYWEQNPPAHLMVQTIARLLGWTRRESSSDAMPIADIVAAAPPGLAVARGASLNNGLGMPAPLDVDGLRARNRAHTIAIARRNRAVASGSGG